ncbi:class I SAM-dependent methyltransferase [Roseivivax isoporae]|uniref:Type 12 methyltransferase n=1 Tax=Roseivivax isoporae LMG 25204 TaxID=1449351 RepID=X7FD16_9RHOB|nr:class I SAM-dependent methyltransferase [Roseivivax isoporae]ETX30705.1 type 12 methyltransferase [Roseivivax isoporae LMG 25204]
MRRGFWRLHSGLDREGPGTPDDVLWALDRARVRPRARICDAGCGPGADAVTLATARPMGTVDAIDAAPSLVNEAWARCADLSNVTVRRGDMRLLSGPYDLIWSAGAISFLGVTQGLSAWRRALAPGGTVAFSEPVRPRAPYPAEVARFWADYPQITDLDGIAAQVAAARYRVIDHRIIGVEGWDAYYTPLAARIAELRPDAAEDPDLAEVLDAAEAEIALWRAARTHVTYALILARPVPVPGRPSG